ncbi:CsbD family protein [Sphingomonas yunnanensis]|uniref:CsbD family protein n=1 Tax=Sphingomonas yunnanensis TaxID=310400 RepID=UPI001CA6CC92|nr:CsbD family protein [Sphingomonas yunnanensis]MBY9062013.1 CsbD family protein [Sphingomonas yunnanensis]
MNKHELHGGARYVGGKVEKAIGDTVDSRDWQVSGVKDQFAGGAENLFGRAQSIAEDVADATPGLIEEAREKAGDVAASAADAARRGAHEARVAVRGGDERLLWAAVAALGGFALGWLANDQRG